MLHFENHPNFCHESFWEHPFLPQSVSLWGFQNPCTENRSICISQPLGGCPGHGFYYRSYNRSMFVISTEICLCLENLGDPFPLHKIHVCPIRFTISSVGWWDPFCWIGMLILVDTRFSWMWMLGNLMTQDIDEILMDDTFFMDTFLRYQQCFEFQSAQWCRSDLGKCKRPTQVGHPLRGGLIRESPGVGNDSNLSPKNIPSRSLTVRPWKSYLPNRKVVFQPPFFRGELLNFGGVSVARQTFLIGRDSWQRSTLCSFGRWHLGWNRCWFLERMLGDFLLAFIWIQGTYMDICFFLMFCIGIWSCIYICTVYIYTCFMCTCTIWSKSMDCDTDGQRYY